MYLELQGCENGGVGRALRGRRAEAAPQSRGLCEGGESRRCSVGMRDGGRGSMDVTDSRGVQSGAARAIAMGGCAPATASGYAARGRLECCLDDRSAIVCACVRALHLLHPCGVMCRARDGRVCVRVSECCVCTRVWTRLAATQRGSCDLASSLRLQLGSRGAETRMYKLHKCRPTRVH